MKPFLILQLRPEDAAAEGELQAFMDYGGITSQEVVRIRMEQEGIPDVDLRDFSAIIIGGGASNVSDSPQSKPEYQRRFEADIDRLLPEIYSQDFPFLGSCYGFGKLIQVLGGTVSKAKFSEPVGTITINLTDEEDDLTKGLFQSFQAMGGHKEACQQLPEKAVVLAGSEGCPYQIIRLKKNIYGTQFHAELDGPGLAVRIGIYKNAGYFRPEEAEDLINRTINIPITQPMIFLSRFVEKYRTS